MKNEELAAQCIHPAWKFFILHSKFFIKTT